MGNSNSSLHRLQSQIAANLKKIRLLRGMTQEQVAQSAEVAVRHLQKIEAAEINVTIDTLNRLATALDIEVASLMSKCESEQSDERSGKGG